MDVQDKDAVKAFWDGRAGDASIENEEVTHRDIWQRHLEIEMLSRLVKPTDRVLDVGSGNGYTVRHLAPKVSSLVAVDYSAAMIARARESWEQDDADGSVEFHECNVLDLSPDDYGYFDVVLTERCLINLSTWQEQQRAIANIAGVLKPGGRYLFLEGSRDGRDNLNAFRQQAGLEPMPPVWHNLDFDEAATLAFMEQFFSVQERLHFGLYDFLARVVNPLLVAPEQPQYDAKINEIAANLAVDCQAFPSISRVLFLVLEKRSDGP